MSDQASMSIETVYQQHSARARTLSELVTKLLMKRRGQMPKNFDELLQDFDIIKRAHEHIGACQGMNELRALLWPEEEEKKSFPQGPASPLP